MRMDVMRDALRAKFRTHSSGCCLSVHALVLLRRAVVSVRWSCGSEPARLLWAGTVARGGPPFLMQVRLLELIRAESRTACRLRWHLIDLCLP
jgi:predicted NAD-dependent protein-ADP-ribosyltransferase YbiA (DUF1768 family)